MDLVFKAGLVVVLGAAVIIGIVAGRSQPSFVASAPLPTATAIPAPPPGVVEINPNPSGQSSAVYKPSTITVRVGDIVTWVNISGADTSVTADNGAFNSDVIDNDQIFQWKAKKAGTYTYGSFLDPDLRGTVRVAP